LQKIYIYQCAKMKRVLLIRHAESVNNKIHKALGNTEAFQKTRESDPSLTEKGFEQANVLAKILHQNRHVWFKTEPVIYSSPMLRALQTAKPIANVFNTGIIAWPNICEKNGIYHKVHDLGVGRRGLTIDGIGKAIGDWKFRWRDPCSHEGWWEGDAENGMETEGHFKRRLEEVCSELGSPARGSQLISAGGHVGNRRKDECVLVISHGKFIANLCRYLFDAPDLGFTHFNTGVTCFEVAGGKIEIMCSNWCHESAFPVSGESVLQLHSN